MDGNDIKVEKARSWFVLAQLLMILSGFLFATSSIALTNSQHNLDSSVESTFKSASIVGNILQAYPLINNDADLAKLYTDYLRITETLNDYARASNSLSKSNSEYAQSAFFTALFFSFISILFFLIGRNEINRIRPA